MYAQVDENDETGVTFVSLVDKPAVKMEWHAFSEQKDLFKFKDINEEKRIVTGAAMLADFPIYRKMQDQEFMLVFDADTIWKMGKKFARANRYNSVNTDHSTEVEGVYLLESFFTNEERGIMPPKGFETAKDGSWFMSYLIDNDEVWEKVKDGTWNGFSVEGYFGLSEQSEMSEICAAIEELTAMVKNFRTIKK